ncbi:methyltransferase domain-containing protein [uncultured Roseovarius sp.]|uniref:methyltransferase domain-containing protein n=1 Tax=uncultured Roseovarius sp. TaxID=293344 RepID=UPI00260EF4A6|nr:methyltransferase domain-containing protein [uncultured Roseovarius sp.]
MPDPFQDVSSAGDEMIGQIIDALEDRADDPAMTEIIDRYFADLDWHDGGTLLEIGCGTGPVARAAARHSPGTQVIGTDPATELIEDARRRGKDIPNLAFEACDGARQHMHAASVDAVILHTVLSHVTQPQALLAEAFRVLRPGGQVVICDADFSRLSLALCPDDPMEACAIGFSRNFVTDPWLSGRLRPLLAETGFKTEIFRTETRLDLEGHGGPVWTKFATGHLVAEGIIGQPLADALIAECQRRIDAGTLYGFNPFVTAVARRS